MKKLLFLWVLAFCLSGIGVMAQSSEVKKEKVNATQSGAILASQTSEFWLHASKMANQDAVHALFQKLENGDGAISSYMPRDYCPTVAIPIAALVPVTNRRMWVSSYGSSIQISLSPLTYPGQWNYFNVGYTNRPLKVPFQVARTL